MKRTCPLCGHPLQDEWNVNEGVVCKPPRGCGATIYSARQRTCKQRDCITFLSVRDPGPYCWVHTPAKPDRATDHGIQRSKATTMSAVFIAGEKNADVLTWRERRRYRRGDW